MLSKFSHIFFNSSIIIPYIFAVGIYSILFKDTIFGVVCIFISVLLMVLQIKFISYIKNNLQVFNINIDNISDGPSDWYIVSFISYFSPFLEKLLNKQIDNYNYILLIIALLLILFGNKTTDNPMLKILGYNTYIIGTRQGKDFKLLSKKKIRKSNDVTQVIRIFEDILMEVE